MTIYKDQSAQPANCHDVLALSPYAPSMLLTLLEMYSDDDALQTLSDANFKLLRV